MVSLASKNLHGPRCLNMRILSSPFFFEWHQVVLGNWLKSPLVVSLGWSHRPRGRLVRHEIIVHQLIHDAAGGWVRLPKLVMECAMLVSRVQVRQRIDLVTKFSIHAVDDTRTAPENHKVADWQEMSHDCCCQIRCQWSLCLMERFTIFSLFLKKKYFSQLRPYGLSVLLKKQLWHSVSDMKIFLNIYSQHFQATICQGRVF